MDEHGNQRLELRQNYEGRLQPIQSLVLTGTPEALFLVLFYSALTCPFAVRPSLSML